MKSKRETKCLAFANQPKEFGFNFKGKEEHQTVLVKEVLWYSWSFRKLTWLLGKVGIKRWNTAARALVQPWYAVCVVLGKMEEAEVKRSGLVRGLGFWKSDEGQRTMGRLLSCRQYCSPMAPTWGQALKLWLQYLSINLPRRQDSHFLLL